MADRATREEMFVFVRSAQDAVHYESRRHGILFQIKAAKALSRCDRIAEALIALIDKHGGEYQPKGEGSE